MTSVFIEYVEETETIYGNDGFAKRRLNATGFRS